jgi:hypothetical protein
MERSLRNGAYWRSLLLWATVLAPGVTFAADNGFYLGLASSDVSSNYDLGPFAGADADDDRGFKGMVGFRPLDAFAVEVNYVDLGKSRVPLTLVCVTPPCPAEATIDSQLLSVSAVGMYALPLVDLYGRVGYASWESELSPYVSQKRDGSDPTYGAGAQVRIGSFALRFEYERFELEDDSSDLLSVGFTFTFL